MKTKMRLLSQMKHRRGVNTLILFRNGDYFEAYDNDATIIADMLNLKITIEDELRTVKFPASEIEVNSNKLIDTGHAICISEMRDESGNFIIDIAPGEYEQNNQSNK